MSRKSTLLWELTSVQRSQSLIVRELVDITVDRLAKVRFSTATRARHRLTKQFRDAVGKGDMAAAFNIDRLNHGEEPLEPSSELIVSQLVKVLLTSRLLDYSKNSIPWDAAPSTATFALYRHSVSVNPGKR
jgi:hypothetical protein